MFSLVVRLGQEAHGGTPPPETGVRLFEGDPVRVKKPTDSISMKSVMAF